MIRIVKADLLKMKARAFSQKCDVEKNRRCNDIFDFDVYSDLSEIHVAIMQIETMIEMF